MNGYWRGVWATWRVIRWVIVPRSTRWLRLDRISAVRESAAESETLYDLDTRPLLWTHGGDAYRPCRTRRDGSCTCGGYHAGTADPAQLNKMPPGVAFQPYPSLLNATDRERREQENRRREWYAALAREDAMTRAITFQPYRPLHSAICDCDIPPYQTTDL